MPSSEVSKRKAMIASAPFAEACAAAKEAIAAASLSQNARLSSRFLALVLFYARIGILRVKFGFIFDL